MRKAPAGRCGIERGRQTRTGRGLLRWKKHGQQPYGERDTRHYHQKLKRACNSTTRPARAEGAMPKNGFSGCVPPPLKPNGVRLSWLNALKRLARRSSVEFSLNQGSRVLFASERSVWKKCGPRNELRPMPGGPLAVVLK